MEKHANINTRAAPIEGSKAVPKTYDELLSDTIGQGWYQILHCAGFILGTSFASMQYTFTNFTAAFMNHWCKVPQLQGRFNETLSKNLSIPLATDESGNLMFSQCHMYGVNYSEYTDQELLDGVHKINATTIVCNAGWDYDTSQYESTLMSQFNLVCGNEYLSTFAASAQMLGFLFGAYISGQVADRWGRLRTSLVWTFLQFAFAMGATFSPNYILYLVLRFLSCMSGLAGYTPHFTTCMEVLTSSGRNTYAVVTPLTQVITSGILPLTAFYIRNHITLQIVSASLILIPFVIRCMTPESARWHLSVGQVEAATKVTRIMARINRRKLPENHEQIMQGVAEEERKHEGGKKATIIDIFKTTRMRRNAIIVYAIWFACVFANYAVRLNIGTLIPGSIYLNMYIVLGLSSILGIPIKYVVYYKLGRVKGFMVTLITSGIFSFSMIGFVRLTNITALSTTASLLGIAFAGTAFGIVYVYSGEIFPTPARAAGLGGGSSFGRIGGLITPQIPLLAKPWYGLPYLVMGLIPIITGLLAFFLPETMNKKLPETLLEGELFGTEKYDDLFKEKDEKGEEKANDVTVRKVLSENNSTSHQIYSPSIDPYYSDLPERGNERY